jgi:8-oxo-dGTP pyrophosphatase MutT (NUDIX family)
LPASLTSVQDGDVIERVTVRLVVLDPGGQVLLLHYLADGKGDPFWVTPGGRIEQGESEPAAAMRELSEELGRDDLSPGPCVWERRVTYTWQGDEIRQFERFLVTYAEPFAPELGPDAAREGILAVDWFSVEEVEALTDKVYPEDLATHLAVLLRDGPPPHPIDISL